MNRTKYFDYIEEKLNLFSQRIESRAKLNLLNHHLHAEDFFKQVFNIVYDLNLINSNLLIKNSEGIDLIDKEKKIIISISSTATKTKILSGMSKKGISNYIGYNFKFISISKSADSLKIKTYLENPYNLQFNPATDIFDKDKLLGEILHTNSDKLIQLYKLFRAEFSDNIEFEDDKENKINRVTNLIFNQCKEINKILSSISISGQQGKLAFDHLKLCNLVVKPDIPDDKKIDGFEKYKGFIILLVRNENTNSYLQTLKKSLIFFEGVINEFDSKNKKILLGIIDININSVFVKEAILLIEETAFSMEKIMNLCILSKTNRADINSINTSFKRLKL